MLTSKCWIRGAFYMCHLPRLLGVYIVSSGSISISEFIPHSTPAISMIYSKVTWVCGGAEEGSWGVYIYIYISVHAVWNWDVVGPRAQTSNCDENVLYIYKLIKGIYTWYFSRKTLGYSCNPILLLWIYPVLLLDASAWRWVLTLVLATCRRQTFGTAGTAWFSSSLVARPSTALVSLGTPHCCTLTWTRLSHLPQLATVMTLCYRINVDTWESDNKVGSTGVCPAV